MGSGEGCLIPWVPWLCPPPCTEWVLGWGGGWSPWRGGGAGASWEGGAGSSVWPQGAECLGKGAAAVGGAGCSLAWSRG